MEERKSQINKIELNRQNNGRIDKLTKLWKKDELENGEKKKILDKGKKGLEKWKKEGRTGQRREETRNGRTH